MNCDDARTSFLAGDAGHSELDHLASCVDCREQWPSLEASRGILDDPALWEEPSPSLESRVVAMISGSPAPRSQSARTTIPRGWRWVSAGVAAAAIVVAVAWIGLRGPSPDWELAIPGTQDAPLATGVIQGWNETGGTRVVLDVQGLPAAPEGSVYELWFSKDELHISAGTFTEAGEVALWVGVSRGDFPRLWITLEPLDDDESPSGVNLMDTS